jgi:hypothetical protein
VLGRIGLLATTELLSGGGGDQWSRDVLDTDDSGMIIEVLGCVCHCITYTSWESLAMILFSGSHNSKLIWIT